MTSRNSTTIGVNSGV